MALLRVQVKPRSHHDALVARDGAGLLTVQVTAAPADGQANKAVCVVVARALDVPKSSVRVVRGQTARTKTLEVEGLDEAELAARLDEALA